MSRSRLSVFIFHLFYFIAFFDFLFIVRACSGCLIGLLTGYLRRYTLRRIHTRFQDDHLLRSDYPEA
jgi:NhaP-type Na+/H+ or K+/H+ antiporter